MFKQIVQAFTHIVKERPDIFDSIYGHELIKQLLKSIIHASAPVHLLLAGPPGCGKTEFCKALKEFYPQLVIWLEGENVTVAGIIQQLVEKPNAKFIIYNEVGDAKPPVRLALLEILENGTVSKTMKTETFKINHPVWFIGTTNEIKNIPKQFLNRLIVKQIEPYTQEQFIEVGVFTAVKQGVTKEVAEHIAKSVLDKFGITALRRCRDLARMSKTVADVDVNIGLL